MTPDLPILGAPFAVVDFETTGFAGPDCHVVEVAVVHGQFGSDDVRVAFSTRVRPPVAIPESATKVHGISDADVADAPPWADIAEELHAALRGRLPVAYNAPADFLFWFAEFIRCREGTVPADWLRRAAQIWRARRWFDLYALRKATMIGSGPRKLAEVVREFGIDLDAHGATGDALATALLIAPMMREALGTDTFADPRGAWGARRWDCAGWPAPTTVGELLGWQREAALHQERDFAAYQQRNGKPPPDCWHHILEGEARPTWEVTVPTTRCTCGAETRRKVGQGGALEIVNTDGSAHACPSSARHP